MKKAVVLLITLFFISAISILVLKNLDDTDKFLEKENYILNNTQVLISIKNIQKEVLALLEKNREKIEKVLENSAFEDTILSNDKQLNIKYSVKKYDKIDINEIQNKKSRIVEEFFLSNNIFDYDYFVEIYKKKLKKDKQRVQTSKQLDAIINTFIIKSENKEILKYKDELGFIKADNGYELFIDINHMDAIASAYYLLSNINGKVEVQYFDISFK